MYDPAESWGDPKDGLDNNVDYTVHSEHFDPFDIILFNYLFIYFAVYYSNFTYKTTTNITVVRSRELRA